MTAKEIRVFMWPTNVDDIEAAFQKSAGNRSKLLYMCSEITAWISSRFNKQSVKVELFNLIPKSSPAISLLARK